jgi:site-specific DNA recombinase
MKQGALTQNIDRQSKRQRIAEMTEFLNRQTGVIIVYDDKLVRRLVERVTVFDGKVVVWLKSGVEIGEVVV